MRGRIRTAAALGAACAALGACEKPLMAPGKDRTQYDQYDKSRERFAPQDVFDEFGYAHPNLRARLLPKGY